MHWEALEVMPESNASGNVRLVVKAALVVVSTICPATTTEWLSALFTGSFSTKTYDPSVTKSNCMIDAVSARIPVKVFLSSPEV